MTSSKSKYDPFFSRSMEYPPIAQALFKQYLPEHLRQPAHLDTLVRVDRTNTNKKLAQRRRDIVYKAQMEDEIVGVLTFAPGDKKRTAHWGEFGMSIQQAYWGQGIGKKLLGLLINWARANPHLDRIMLNVDANNLRGRSLYQKLGFLEEGLQHKAIKFTDGRYSDNVLMAMWVGE